MRRGYIFTIDAVLALILVIIFSTFIIFSHLGSDTSKQFDNYKRQTEDATMMGLYLGQDATFFGMSENTPTAETYYCSYGFEYNYQLGQVDKKTYCQGDA